MHRPLRSLYLLLCLSILFSLSAQATSTANKKAHSNIIYHGASGGYLTFEEFVASLNSGDILVIGEQHAQAGDSSSVVHQGHQVQLLSAVSQRLVAKNQRLFVGMEFLEYPKQNFVDDYLYGILSDEDFQREVQWGGSPFALYREQILAPRMTSGKTLALNIPRDVTSQVARGGLSSLSQAQRALLPPTIARGNDLYLERFIAATGGHIPPDKIADYFWAQSIWDETMAWQALNDLVPDAFLAIIVGEFHVEYGGGLPERLKARGALSVKTLVQRKLSDLSQQTIDAAVARDPRHGPLADYIWLYN